MSMITTTDMIAQAIRVTDGNHDKGAGAIAEGIVEYLNLRGYGIVLMADLRHGGDAR